jgi:hypothetical protein
MNIAKQQYSIAVLLLIIAASSAFAALNVPTALIPRSIFIAMMGLTLIGMLHLIFGMIYIPLRDRAYQRLLPHGIVIVLFAISVIKLSISGFAFDDEIYSWNMWAIQHFNGQTATFNFTLAPYPQLFPYWIAALYQALGTITIHSIPRFFLALPTLLLGMAVIALARIPNWRVAGLVSLILILAFGPISIRLAKGLADPLMAAAMIVSVMLLIAYAREPQKLTLLCLSAVCAIVASLTKQAGLIWACFSLPVMIVIGCRYYGWPRRALILAGATLVLAAIWPLWIAPSFVNNGGVINASMAHRSYFQQFGYAVEKYLIGYPEISVLLIACIASVWRHPPLRVLLFVALLPMLLAWFIFGAYEIRLGMHVLALAALLTICAFTSSTSWKPAANDPEFTWSANTGRFRTVLMAGLLTGGIFFALWLGVLNLARKNEVDLGDGAKTTLRTQYGPDSRAVFDQILSEKARIWATSGYTYGPFFGRVPVTMPDYAEQPYTVDSVKRNLLAFAADYAAESGKIGGASSELLTELAHKCPTALLPVLQPPNQYDFTLYKVNLSHLSTDCQ